MRHAQTRNYFWFSLSLGLALHLLLTVVQMSGWLGNFSPIAGSSPQDATGYIGHIGFGFVYGIWAGWLIYWGYLQQLNRLRLTAWFFATWSLWMTFAAQGRSGYLVAIVILLFLVWNYFIKNSSKITLITTLTVIPCFFLAILLSNLDHPRIQITIHSIENIFEGKSEKAEDRWLLWKSAIEISKQYPVFGVGTGGYKNAALALEESKKEVEGVAHYDHPHQLYLLALVRWGILGPMIIIGLLFAMFHIHRRKEKPENMSDTYNSYKILGKISTLALATHGLSAISMEAHATMLMALFSLALAISVHGIQGSPIKNTHHQ
ncbi:MAG: O-antigen ligase family protein [Mariprofundaceae bacterium]